MQLSTTQAIINDIRSGKMVILMDDEKRENEGDLIIAAEKITPQAVNFMVKEARGLLCQTMTPQMADRLELPLMTKTNGDKFSTNFTVSIEAAHGVTTGISASDRAATISTAAAFNAQPRDIVSPGHIFPVVAQPGGVLHRPGHTEAGCDLARLAGLAPSSAIIEIMNPDGSMARRADLERFASQHDIKLGTIADLIRYRLEHEMLLELTEQKPLNTPFGQFDLYRFQYSPDGSDCYALLSGQARSRMFSDKRTDAFVQVPIESHTLQHELDWLTICGSEVMPSLQRMSQSCQGGMVIINTSSSLSEYDICGQVLRFLQQNAPGWQAVSRSCHAA